MICTLGTTIRKAGSQEAFRRVDHDFPPAVARLARQHGVRALALNSATGADPRSRIFYNRVIRGRGTAQAVIKISGRSYMTGTSRRLLQPTHGVRASNRHMEVRSRHDLNGHAHRQARRPEPAERHSISEPDQSPAFNLFSGDALTLKSSELQADLTEVSTCLFMPERIGNVGKSKAAVDDGP